VHARGTGGTVSERVGRGWLGHVRRLDPRKPVLLICCLLVTSAAAVRAGRNAPPLPRNKKVGFTMVSCLVVGAGLFVIVFGKFVFR
jgi:hypothetical protein